MKRQWPMVPLGEVLRLDLDRVVVDASRTYPMVGVYSFGRGLFDREPVEAGKTSYRHFFRLKADHIIMSQLFGWEGALALSSPQFTGKFVSPQFPTFLCDELKLDRLFLKWLMKRPMFWQDLGSRASGMGDRRRTLNPDALFKCEIPLPSLSEQQRIVARIEELAVKIEEARGLRRQAVAETTSFVSSLHLSLAGERVVALGDILRLDESKEEVQFGQQYPQVGVKGFGQGLFPRETLEATQTTYRGFNRLYEGAIVLSQVKGWEGAIAACGSDLAGRYVSPEYRTFRCLEGRAIPEYLAALVTTPWFWTQLKDVTRGVGARRERTRPEQFLQMKLPMPEIDRQAKAVPAFDKLQILKRLQAETAAELDALPPSVLDKAFKGEL